MFSPFLARVLGWAAYWFFFVFFKFLFYTNFILIVTVRASRSRGSPWAHYSWGVVSLVIIIGDLIATSLYGSDIVFITVSLKKINREKKVSDVTLMCLSAFFPRISQLFPEKPGSLLAISKMCRGTHFSSLRSPWWLFLPKEVFYGYWILFSRASSS